MRRHFSAVINAVQAHGIQDEMAVIRQAVAQGLAVHEIHRHHLQKFRRKRGQSFRISSVMDLVSLQRERGDEDSAAGFCFSGIAKKTHASLLKSQSRFPEVQDRLKP